MNQKLPILRLRLEDALSLMRENRISGLPVVDGNLVSAGTWHDYDTQFFKIFLQKMRESAGR